MEEKKATNGLINFTVVFEGHEWFFVIPHFSFFWYWYATFAEINERFSNDYRFADICFIWFLE